MDDLIACPKCGSTKLENRGKRSKESELLWLKCQACGHRHRWHTAAIVPVRGFVRRK